MMITTIITSMMVNPAPLSPRNRILDVEWLFSMPEFINLRGKSQIQNNKLQINYHTQSSKFKTV
jgi:hypothetical protein